MEHIIYNLGFLYDLGLVIIISTVLAYFAKALKQPLLIAYVIAGVIIGPFGMGWITSMENISTLAQIGVAFLLFTIGLELDFKKLKSVGTASVTGAVIQMLLTFVLGYSLSIFFGLNQLMATYVGFLFAFSSTMIVAKMLVDRDEISTLHGRTMLAILLIQDVVVIILLPSLSSIHSLTSLEFIGSTIIKALGLFSIALVLNRFVFGKILDYAAKTKELLFFTAISICFVFIGLAYSISFSIAVGAFIAGISLANFPYNIEISSEIRSLRDFFSIIFFTSLGMQLNPFVIQNQFLLFTVLLLAMLLIKPVILSLTYLLMGYGGRTSSVIGLGLGQASEFSFIIAAQGLALGHFIANPGFYSLLISIVVISMLTTPYFLKYRDSFYRLFSRIKMHSIRRTLKPRYIFNIEKFPEKKLRKHIVVIGGGVTGKGVINYIISKKRKFIVIDSNPEVVKSLSSQGIYCIYGNICHEEVLKKSRIYHADMAVITAPDIHSSVHTVEKVKKFNPDIKFFVRAHTSEDAEALHKAGADFIVVPELVSGSELIRLMGMYL
jgi:Kef-type K+ transport system membrane component KefB